MTSPQSSDAALVVSADVTGRTCRLRFDEAALLPPVLTILRDTSSAAGFLGLPRAPSGEPLLDGPAFAALPIAMAQARGLHLRGALSRSALRHLVEYAASFAAWRPDVLAAVPVTADAVVDLPPEPLGSRALLAWDGSLAAAAAWARHLDGAGAGRFETTALLHVSGLDTPEHDRKVVAAIELAASASGVELIRLSNDPAGVAPLLHPVTGRLPLIAAALHLTAGQHRVGLVARRWPYAALLRRHRPQPHVPDMCSGDRFCLLTEGGGAGLHEAVALVARYPVIAAAIRPTSIDDARLTSLGFALAGITPPPEVELPDPVAAALRLNLADVVVVALALGLVREPSNHPARALLRARLKLLRVSEIAGDHFRYLGALLGTAAPWPR